MSILNELEKAKTTDDLIKIMYATERMDESFVIEKAVSFALEQGWIEDSIIEYEYAVMLEFNSCIAIAFAMIPKHLRLAGLWQAVKKSDQPWWGCDISVFEEKDRPESYKMVHGARGAKSPAMAILISLFMVHLALDKNP